MMDSWVFILYFGCTSMLLCQISQALDIGRPFLLAPMSLESPHNNVGFKKTKALALLSGTTGCLGSSYLSPAHVLESATSLGISAPTEKR